MKKIKEIAELLDVSQVTVYNHIKKIDDKLQGHIFKEQGATHLDDEGIRQLKISMGLIQVPTVQEYTSLDDLIQGISSLVNESIEKSIKDHYQGLERELEGLRQQNQKLIELIEKREAEIELEKNKSFKNKIRDFFKGV